MQRTDPYGDMHSAEKIGAVVMILMAMGTVFVFSASASLDQQLNLDRFFEYQGLRQIIFFPLAVLVMLLAASVDHRKLSFAGGIMRSPALYLLAASVLLLILVLIPQLGVERGSARRWLHIPLGASSVSFQPSELAKLAAVFCFAGYTSWVRRRRAAGKIRARSAARQFFLDGFVDILFPGFALLLWVGLILWQPHLSGAVIMCFITLTVFLSSGIRFRSFLSGFTMVMVLLMIVALLAVTVLPAVVPQDKLKAMIQENFAHVEKRIDTFLNPEDASSDDLLQINQSIIAIGSGGLTGLGLGEGRQKYNYLPESHNDFVFAIIGEELGFAGTVSVVLLFVLFLIFGVSVAIGAANPFSTILASGYTLLIVVQAFLNIGVTTRVLPTTGISLPFFSYGGTANMFFLLAIGFVLCVSRSGQRPSNRRI